MVLDKPGLKRVEADAYVFPASFAQKRLWFIEQLFPETSLYVIPLVFRLTGKLQQSPLQQSMQTIVQRHEILRTTFDVIDGHLVQVIASDLSLSLQSTDLRSQSENTREAIALEQIGQVIQQPFDLKQGPLFRVRLWQLQDSEHFLLLVLHHIIFDEWSSGVLIRELGELYGALVEGQPTTLPELPIQYADFAHWQRQWLQGDVLNIQLRYWKQQLQDVPVLDLSGVQNRSFMQEQRHRGASQLLELPQELLNALEELSQRVGVTLFMTLLDAFQTLLHRYTGQTDIAIGSPIANRQRSELEGLIGFLVNSLVLRTNLAGNPSFRQLLARVKQVTLAAYAHQDLPFEKLVEELQPVRNLTQNPLFQVVFALQNTPMEQLVLPDLVLSPVELKTQTARFDLELYVWKCGDNFRNLWGKGWQQTDGLRGVIIYNRDLFDVATITSMRHHFQTLLENIVVNPDTPLSSLSLLTPAAQQTLLQQWYCNQSDYPEVGIHKLFEAQVEQNPLAIAIQFGQQQFTYEALNQGSNQLARYLQRFNITIGTSVGICLERSGEAIAAMLGVLKAGGVYVPLDPSHPTERLHFILKDAGISVVLTQSNWADALQCLGISIVCLEQLWSAIAQESTENLSLLCTANQLAYVMYTSGSTGIPKGVMVPHRAVNRLVCATNYVQIQPSDRVAQVANLAFDAATFEVWGALLNGAQLIGIERDTTLSAANFATELQQQQISILFLTTALFNQTVSQVPTAFQPLRYLLFGGEMVNVECVRLVLQQGKPQHLIHVYGPTENTTFSTWYEIETVSEYAKTIPIGQAIANTQVYVLDDQFNPVPANVSGEIYLGGAGLAEGYLNRPELTEERFISFECLVLSSKLKATNSKLNLSSTETLHVKSATYHKGKASPQDLQNSKLYKTGDRARYRADGNLEFLGRTDDQIKIRGFRVELGEIETVLAQHPSVQSAVVVARELATEIATMPQERQLIAYVTTCAETVVGPSIERELRLFLKQRLPAYMVPAAFVPLDKLPLTANGKIDQKALPLPHQPSLSETRPASAPTTSIEAALVEVWSQLLGRCLIGIDDNFFELGGHSLLATQLVSRIRDRFQVELPLRCVFEAPTIVELAQTLTSQLTSQLTSDSTVSTISPISPTPATSYPLSFAQQRLWFLYQLAPDNPFYNVPAAIWLRGSLDQKALKQAFKAIVQRHATLRTRFTIRDGEPVQIVSVDVNVNFSVVDLHTVPVHEREQVSQRLAVAEAHHPFNLAMDLPLRVTLLQFDATKALLLLTMHHIVADGWSIGVLIRELAQLYTALIEGETLALPALPIQYTDFVYWQRNRLQADVLAPQLAYWRNQLRDLPMLDLPSDRPRPAMQTYRGATQPLHIPPSLTQALISLSQQAGVSLFMILLAAFQTLLHRYTGQDDIAVGAPIANRHHRDLEGLIGFFVNSLVMRADLSGNPTFRELLEQVRDTALKAYEYQDLPFEKLVEVMEPERDLGRNPLFQVAFALQNAPVQTLELPGLLLEPMPLESISTRFDLEVHLWEPTHGLRQLWQSQDGLSGFISYSTDLFDSDRIQRLVGHFQTLLAGIVANPDARLADLPLLTPSEYQQITVDWNQTNTSFTTDLCFHQIFEVQAQHTPDALAIVTEQQCLTYRELNERADQLVQILNQMGVQPNTLVGLAVDRSADMVIGILGILKAGAAYVPLDPNYPSERLHFMLTDTQVSILLTQSWLTASLPVCQAKLICLDQPFNPLFNQPLLNQSSPISLTQHHRTTPDNLAYIIYTSGSTGIPKGVLLSHRGLSNVVQAQRQLFDANSNSRVLQFSSLSFDASVFEIALALGSGGRLYIPPKPAQLPGTALVQFLQDNAITHALLTPAVLAVLPPADLPALQILITGGEACSQQVVNRWAKNRRFFNAYGPTESTIFVTVAKLAPGDSPSTIGYPIQNAQVYILDAYLKPVPIGVPGELYISGTGIAQGYLHRPELTKEKFIRFECSVLSSKLKAQYSTLYKTGDRARYHADGAIEFLGRVDTQIKIRGFRVELAEIEATLQRHAAIQDAVVIASDTSSDMRLIAYFSLDLTRFTANQKNLDPLCLQSQSNILQSLQSQHLQHWQTLYDQTYQPEVGSQKPEARNQHWQILYNQTHQSKDEKTENTKLEIEKDKTALYTTASVSQPNSKLKTQNSKLNITGWNSSYTGHPIPLEQMQEWVNDRVQQILALRPKRVLEIGCGTGLLLFSIAPHCQNYVGTDFSEVVLQSLQHQLDQLDLPQVELLHRSATDLEGIDAASFDLVILNSIVQYFPSQEYLMQVLEVAMRAVAPGGHVFVGDVRSLPLLTAFHTWVQFSQADASTERNQLQVQVERSQFEEPELAIDPRIFYALPEQFPQIRHVLTRLSRGPSLNEMTQFRYNVLLHLGETQDRCDLIQPLTLQPLVSCRSIDSIPTHDWKLVPVSVSTIQVKLIETEPAMYLITNVMNSRVNDAVQTVNWLYGQAAQTAPKTVGQMREWLKANKNSPAAVDPEDWWDLETLLPYRVEITWSAKTDTGDYDVLLIRHGVEAKVDVPLAQSYGQFCSTYTNYPLQSQLARQLIPELRQFLKQSLPDYMIPAAFVPLATLPRTTNGKVDRARIAKLYEAGFMKSACAQSTNSTIADAVGSETIGLLSTELILKDIWKELLRLSQVNIHDNFFELGGHSLLATQMASRIRDVFGLELPLKSVFEAPTIAQLAALLETQRYTTPPSVPPFVRLDRSRCRRKTSTFCAVQNVEAGELTEQPLMTEMADRTYSQSSAVSLVALTLGNSQSPFFCIHPMFGVVFPYLELAYHLEHHCNFYGLQPLGLDGHTPPLNRIEAMAAFYIEAIQTLQPRGPYFLGGWSFGGLVAFEMAQQLTQAGESIGLLAILDTPAPGYKPAFQSLKSLLGRSIGSSLPFLLNYAAIMTQRWQVHSWLSRWQWSAITRLIPEARLRLLDESAIAPMLRIFYANAQAAYRYVPQYYSNRITLFKATESSHGTELDPTCGWQTWASDVQLHSVPGNHLSLLQPPHVQVLATKLGQCLSEN